MLEDLQQEMGLTYLFVAHDLSMVRTSRAASA
jgi:ABC-type oligopeptide transport system ATPase subunit